MGHCTPRRTMGGRVFAPNKPEYCKYTRLGPGSRFKCAKMWRRDRSKQRPHHISSFPLYFERLFTTHPLRRGSLVTKLPGDRWARVWTGAIYRCLTEQHCIRRFQYQEFTSLGVLRIRVPTTEMKNSRDAISARQQRPFKRAKPVLGRYQNTS